jgi:hypothetical protein
LSSVDWSKITQPARFSPAFIEDIKDQVREIAREEALKVLSERKQTDEKA